MSKGIIITTTDVNTASSDERVVDSRLQGSWKIAKRINIPLQITYTSGTAVSQVQSQLHGLGFTPAFIAMVNSDIGGSLALYNIPYFDVSLSCKVYVDKDRVYVSVVSGHVGTTTCNFKILLLGEKIE